MHYDSEQSIMYSPFPICFDSYENITLHTMENICKAHDITNYDDLVVYFEDRNLLKCAVKMNLRNNLKECPSLESDMFEFHEDFFRRNVYLCKKGVFVSFKTILELKNHHGFGLNAYVWVWFSDDDPIVQILRLSEYVDEDPFEDDYQHFKSYGYDECENCGYETSPDEDFIIHGEDKNINLLSICPKCGCELALDQQLQM